MSTTPWWSTFFHGFAAESWILLESSERTRAQVDHLLGHLELPAGGEVLDVPCGTGHHTRELARRGFRVTGVDLSSTLLASGRSRPKEVTPGSEATGSVTLLEGDMRELPWPGRFDGAYCVGNSFGYLDDAGNRAFPRAVARALKPGARFLLETGVLLECLLPRLDTRNWYAAGDLYMLAERRHRAAEGVLEVNYTFLGRGRTEVGTAHYRTYSVSEVRKILEEAGLEVLSVTGPTPGEPFATGNPMAYFLTRKA